MAAARPHVIRTPCRRHKIPSRALAVARVGGSARARARARARAQAPAPVPAPRLAAALVIVALRLRLLDESQKQWLEKKLCRPGDEHDHRPADQEGARAGQHAKHTNTHTERDRETESSVG